MTERPARYGWGRRLVWGVFDWLYACWITVFPGLEPGQ